MRTHRRTHSRIIRPVKKTRLFKSVIVGLSVVIFAAGAFVAFRRLTSVSAVDAPFTFTAAGDYSFSTESKNTVAAIVGTGSQFHLALGDFAYTTTRTEGEFCDMVTTRVGATFPFQLVSGDHENDAVGDDGYIDNFASCLPDRMNAVVSPNGKYAREYYFDYQNVRFIIVNPGISDGADAYDYSTGSTHYLWLQDRIREAKALGKWVVVANHANCITMGVKSCVTGTDFVNLVIGEGVDLVLQGNDHGYQRTKQLTCAAPGVYDTSCTAAFEGRGNTYLKGYGTVFMIVAAAGTTPMYNINTADPEAGYMAAYMGANSNPTHGLAKFDVTAGGITVTYVPTSNGTFTDSFSIGIPGITPAPTPVSTVIPAVLTGDATVKKSSPTRNYGTLTMVETDGSPLEDFLLKFAVTGTTGQTITRAKLRLYTVNGSNNGGVVYQATGTTWTESGTGGVTWNTAPAAMGTPLSSLGRVNVNTWYEVDVTPAVAGDGTVSFRIKSTSSDGADYAANGHASGNAPQLLVSVAGGSVTPTLIPTDTPVETPTPTDMQTPAPTPTDTPTPTPQPGGTPVEITIPVAEDSFIAKGAPTSNFGTRLTLQNDASPVRDILLKFNVTGIGTRTVTAASLKLYNREGAPSGGTVYSALSSDWTETSVNWNNAPPLGTLITSIGPVSGTSTVPVLYTLDITGAVSGDGSYTFRIPGTSEDSADYAAKEGVVSHRPELVLTVQ